MWQKIDLEEEIRKTDTNMASDKKMLKKFQSFKSLRILSCKEYEPNDNQM